MVPPMGAGCPEVGPAGHAPTLRHRAQEATWSSPGFTSGRPGGPTHISGIDYHSIPHEHLRARVPVNPKVARVAWSSMLNVCTDARDGQVRTGARVSTGMVSGTPDHCAGVGPSLHGNNGAELAADLTPLCGVAGSLVKLGRRSRVCPLALATGTSMS
jgi:hypothetical protein